MPSNQITVKPIDANTFQVTVTGDQTTTHTVTVQPAYALKLTAGKASTETLVEKSFEFLLQREDNSSILRSFALPVIERYFPGYETAISQAFL